MTGAGTTRLGQGLAAVGLASLVFAILAVIAQGFDGRCARWAASLPDEAKAWGTMVSRIGQSGYLFAISATIALGALLARSCAKLPATQVVLALVAERASYVFAVLAVTGAVTQVIKQSIGRGRPPFFEEHGAFHFDSFTLTDAYASFPSGHASTSFAVATALSLLAPSLRAPLMILAAAIAASRVVVQAHFASDVVGGSALGVALALLVARLFARFGIAFVLERRRAVLKGAGALQARLVR